MRNHAQTLGNPSKTQWVSAAAAAVISLAPVLAHAQSPDLPPGDPIQSWLAMVSASQAAQPSWMTPLVTVTPRLEQEFRFDFYDQQNGTGSQGNGQHLVNYGGPGGARVEFIPAYNWEVIVATPPYVTASGPKGDAEGPGDWPGFLIKYRLLSANAENGDYIATVFLQETTALGTAGKISSNVNVLQPTLALGKGWGDFNIQTTISEQFPFSGIASHGNPASVNLRNFGDPVLWNTAFQYHFMEYFWPELEVNFEYWPNGEHEGLTQVLLTPGIIFGRFKIGMDSQTRPINLIFGAGYQIAVTPNPVTQNNWVATMRITF